MSNTDKQMVTPEYVEIIPNKDLMKENTLYISERYETASHLCLCGCKMLVVTPLSKGWWRLIKNDELVSLDPSIGNWQQPCRSHYYITNNMAVFV